MNHLKTLVAENSALDQSLKFDFGRDGFLDIDGEDASNYNNNVNCTIIVSKANFLKIAKGQMNPMSAIMMGRARNKGDKTLAMGLQTLFSLSPFQ